MRDGSCRVAWRAHRVSDADPRRRCCRHAATRTSSTSPTSTIAVEQLAATRQFSLANRNYKRSTTNRAENSKLSPKKVRHTQKKSETKFDLHSSVSSCATRAAIATTRDESNRFSDRTIDSTFCCSARKRATVASSFELHRQATSRETQRTVRKPDDVDTN